jgi:hypothetical protein
VLFPRLSEKEPDAEGVLATWFVSDGDQVASGQLLGGTAAPDQIEVSRSKLTSTGTGVFMISRRVCNWTRR